MRRQASRELLAPRADVWAFLAEPHHLPDWWPVIRGVQPDRRGFATDARWQVMALQRRPLVGSRDPKPSVLVVGAVEEPERWSWHLTGDLPLDVDVRLDAAGEARTRVTIAVEGSRLANPKRLARSAADRLYDLVQTAAEL